MWLMAIFSKQCDPEMESLLLLAGLQIPAGQADVSGNIQVEIGKRRGAVGGLFGKMCEKCFGFLCAAMKTREQRKIIDRKAVM